MLRMLKQTTGVVLAAALSLPGSPVAAQTVVDPQLETGIRQVRGGDFEGAALTLDGVVRRLAGQREKAKDLARAYMYLSVAYLGLSQEATAKAKFLEAWKADPKMEINASEFPPKFLHFLEEARREAISSQPPQPQPSPAPAPQSAAAVPKKGGSKTIPLVLGAVALAGAGVAVAAGGGGGGSSSAPPTTLPASVTGRWVGTGSDGMFVLTNVSCVEEFDIALDLTQSGTNLTGTMTLTVRKPVARPECPPPGFTTSYSLSGTVASGSINFSLAIEPPFTSTFTGTFTNTRMSGTVAGTGFNGQPQTARWSANRQ